MALFEVRYFSEALGKATAAFVVVPDSGSGPFPVMYLLHGLSDDYSIWLRRTSIERYASEHELIVVMPDGGRSFYTDAVEGFQYETALRVELAEKIEGWFQPRRPWCVTGLSMGGYGAMLFGLRDPERFASVSSHSGALDFAAHPIEGDEARDSEWRRLVGANPVGGPYDLYALASSKPELAIRFDCGTEDFLLESNRSFRDHLVRLELPHTYEEFSGAHTWAYWDEHVRKSLAFHSENLGQE